MIAALLLALAAAPSPGDLAPASLWDEWPSRRFVSIAAPCLRPDELAGRVRALEAKHAGRVRVEEVGRSAEGRPIPLLVVGRGPRRVLLWSQMHGDEPSATPALLDALDTLLSGRPGSEAILDRLTLLVVPMLNPDGALRYERRNAQGIDVNRDALVLASPEGRALKAVRDRFEPEIGFNLHDQNRRTTVGDTGVLASIALLAVSGDEQGTLTPGRARAKRVASLLARTLSAYVPGGVSRYDEDWNPRAFGDNLTAWGTPVVLVESGGVPPGRPFTDLTRLNYVGLLVVLDALARDDAVGEDPAVYEGLKRNTDGLFVDVLLAGGRVAQPTAPEPYRADVAFDVEAPERDAACATSGGASASRVREVGDGRLLVAGRRVDLADRLVVPAFVASVAGRAPWLDAAALDAMARLGVGRVRWAVRPSRRADAERAAARLVAPGRPAVEVVDAAAPACPLRVSRRPRPPAGPSLAEALAALGAHAPAADALLRNLSCAGGPASPLVVPGAPASLVVLKPAAGAPPLDPAALVLETVFVDGRELLAPSPR